MRPKEERFGPKSVTQKGYRRVFHACRDSVLLLLQKEKDDAFLLSSRVFNKRVRMVKAGGGGVAACV